MRFASLGSGSAGNGLVVECDGTRVMLDCGFAIRETEARLGRLGLRPADLTGIVVTHEHEDHASGVFGFARKHRVPVWITYGTLAALRASDLTIDSEVTVHLVSGEQWEM